MATKIRRSFTDEFKREAVSLLTSSGRPLTQVARELGIQPSMLRHWRDDQQTNGTVTRTARSPSSDGMSAEHAEIRRLEKELARAQMERDILKNCLDPHPQAVARCRGAGALTPRQRQFHARNLLSRCVTPFAATGHRKAQRQPPVVHGTGRYGQQVGSTSVPGGHAKRGDRAQTLALPRGDLD